MGLLGGWWLLYFRCVERRGIRKRGPLTRCFADVIARMIEDAVNGSYLATVGCIGGNDRARRYQGRGPGNPQAVVVWRR